MQKLNLLNIQLSDVELFLNVAEYGSFTKAGEKLFMSQSWVSKRISQLEAELGLILFLRNKRSVVLTPAGQTLQQRLRGVSFSILDAIQAAHAAQSGVSGYLRIGYLEWGTIVFMDKLDLFMKENPQLAVEIYRQQFQELRTDMFSGRMDLIFTMSYDCAQFLDDDYTHLGVKRIPLMAYMHFNHPLATRKTLELTDLRAEPLFMVDQKSSSGYETYVREMFAKYGISPNVAQYGNSGGAFIGGILLNRGILLASQYFLEKSWEDSIARVPIRGEEPYVTAIWRTSNPNPALHKFLAAISEADAK